ncbi:hypothetical protein K438DRAFT_1979604 [Mycena galopus ATCC 62051]|nr:hypothetical protein K438DRAFT_1979604 [Mycena galopus ATCC 62051]
MDVPSTHTTLPQGLCVYWGNVDVVAPRAEDLGTLLVMPVTGWSHCWPDACKNRWRPPFVLPPTPAETTCSAASEPRIKGDVQLLSEKQIDLLAAITIHHAPLRPVLLSKRDYYGVFKRFRVRTRDAQSYCKSKSISVEPRTWRRRPTYRVEVSSTPTSPALPSACDSQVSKEYRTLKAPQALEAGDSEATRRDLAETKLNPRKYADSPSEFIGVCYPRLQLHGFTDMDSHLKFYYSRRSHGNNLKAQKPYLVAARVTVSSTARQYNKILFIHAPLVPPPSTARQLLRPKLSLSCVSHHSQTTHWHASRST